MTGIISGYLHVGLYKREVGGWEGDPSRSYAVSAPADRDASQLYYSYRILSAGRGCWAKGEVGGWEGDPSRSYAVSAPADQDASQLYYSYRTF